MSGIIEHDDESTSVIRAGDEGPGISLKAYQDIYHQITGRTEKIRQKFSSNLLIDFSEVEQLQFKIMQLCDVHTVVASNEVVSVFHEKERKEQFTSFERFKAYNSNSTRPTVNVVLRYNFSIALPGRETPQEYVVTIKLTSRVALLNKLESEMPTFLRGGIFGLSTSSVAEISVEYADYVVARSFLESFEEWVQGCKSTPTNKILKFIQSKSHYLQHILQITMAIIFIFFCINSIPEFFEEGTHPEIWARFMVIFFGGFFLLITLSRSTGRIIEHAIDGICPLSYLKLNKGDEKLISEFSTKTNKHIIRFLIGCAVTICLGIISSKLAYLV